MGRLACFAAATIFLFIACADDPAATGGFDGFTAAEWKKVLTHSPLPALPADPSNRHADDARAAAFGQQLFFEKGYSGPLVVGDDGKNGGLGQAGERGKVACVACHSPRGWFDDNGRSNPNNVSLGADWTTRNDPALVNVSFYEFFGWAGKWDTLWMQFTATPENAVMGGTRLGIAHLVYDRYRDAYNAIFSPPLDPALDPKASDSGRFPPAGKPKKAGDPDGPWEKMSADDQRIVNTILANCGKAVEAYERRLLSRNAPFDRYAVGDAGALGAAAKRGLSLFIGKAACDACHAGPFFTDQLFHVTGVAQEGPHVPATDDAHYADLKALLASPFRSDGAFSDDPAWGRHKLAALSTAAPAEADKGMFRTKNLREIAMTAPYMHTGAYATLRDVVDFYDQGGDASGFQGTKDPKLRPLSLSEQEKQDLVEFLKALTGDPVPAELAKDPASP